MLASLWKDLMCVISCSSAMHSSGEGKMRGWRWRRLAVWGWLLMALGMSGEVWALGGLHLQLARFENRQEAEQAFSELKAGRSFELVAELQAPEGLAESKGYLGEVIPERFSSPAREALKGLRPGQFSPPVAMGGVWFLFKALDPAEASRYKPGEESAFFHLQRGILLGELGDSQGELEAYKKAVDLDSHLAAAHVNLGEALRRQAMQILEGAGGNLGEAQARTATQLLDEAIDEFKAAINLENELWEAHFNLGLAYAAQGLLDLSILEFQEAIRIQPESGELHRSLALALLMRERAAEALVHAERAEELGVEAGDILRKIRDRLGSRAAPARK